MIHLLFVGDGPRDAVTVPTLVQKILGIQCGETFRPWARLHGSGRGYGKKLLFAIAQAVTCRADGLVATVDQDRDRQSARLKALRQARIDHRSKHSNFPAAIGEAIPHGEVWLLDDPNAVRRGLRLSANEEIMSVTKTNEPKDYLEKLLADSPRKDVTPRAAWADIAAQVDPARYQHPTETGFKDFANDVRQELGLLGSSRLA